MHSAFSSKYKFQRNSNLEFSVAKKISCRFEMTSSYFGDGEVNTCTVNQTIDSEESIVGSELDATVKIFSVLFELKVVYLPKHIGVKFPNLEEFYLYNADVAKIRDFYFKDMNKLRFMLLSGNKIVTIEAGAFNDLVSMEEMHLSYNQIRTLDERLFLTMLNLRKLYLNNNKIKFLSPTMFNHLLDRDNFEKINLEGNVCIDKNYKPYSFNYLQPDLKSTCSSRLK